MPKISLALSEDCFWVRMLEVGCCGGCCGGCWGWGWVGGRMSVEEAAGGGSQDLE